MCVNVFTYLCPVVCLNNAVPKAAKRRLPGDEDSAYFDDDEADAALGTVSVESMHPCQCYCTSQSDIKDSTVSVKMMQSLLITRTFDAFSCGRFEEHDLCANAC